MGQDQGVRRSKRHLLASRTSCKYPMETYRNKVITSNTVIRSSLVTRTRFSEMSDQWRVSLYMIMYQNVMLHMGDGDFLMFDEIPILTRGLFNV